MKKLLLLVVLCCLVAVLGATAGVVSVPSPSKPLPRVAALAVADAAGFIASGKAALVGTPGIAGSQNIIAARNFFAQAVAADPANQEANFFYGVTRIFAVFEESYGTTDGLDSVKEIFERTGFTFQTFGLYGIEGTEPVDGPLSTMPRSGEVIDFVKLRLLPEIDGALVNLGKVTPAFTPTSITPAALGTYGENLEADYADALAIKALVNLLKCNLNLLVVYGPDVHIPNVAQAPEQMMTYKQLFKDDSDFMTPREASRLGTAKTALLGFIDTFKLASDELKSRPQGTLNHLFVVDIAWEQRTNEPVETESADLDEVNQGLALVRQSLFGATEFPGDGPLQDRTIDLSKFFVTDPTQAISIRSKLSNCAGNTAFPDPTFNGLFPFGLSVHQDAVTEIGPHVLGLTCADKGAPFLDTDHDYIFIWDDPGFPPEPKSLEIFNRGTKDLHVSSISFAGPNAADFTVAPSTFPTSCGSLTPTVAPGESCTVTLNVKRPALNYGYFDAELVLASDDPTNPSERLTVQGHEVPPVAGTVTGRMKDASSLQGLSGIVYFYETRWGNQVGGTQTDAFGNFSINGLSSGTYKVRFSTYDNYYPDQWFQGKYTQESADPVTLTPAAKTLPDVALVKGGMVNGMVKDAVSKQGLGWVSLALYDHTGRLVASGYTGTSGSFNIPRVPAGTYSLKAGNTGGMWVPAWSTVSVTAGSSAGAGEILLNQGATIYGTIRDAGNQSPLSWINVMFYNSQSGEFVAQTNADSAGVYAMNGLPTGSYKVLFSGHQQGYQKLWHSNATSQATATPVTVTAPNVVTINATLARVVSTNTSLAAQSNGGTVTLTATVTSGSGIPGGTVEFWEEDVALGTAQLDAAGKAVITTQLRPGTHYIYAYYTGNSSYNSSSDEITQVVQQQDFALSVNASGEGSGSVHSDPQGIACSKGSSTGCSKTFTGWSQVTLWATPNTGSAFSGWSGACSGTGSCVVTMNGVKSVTATFGVADGTVRIDGVGTQYYTVGGTLNTSAANGKTIRARNQTFTEHVILSFPYEVKLKGGYDASFSTASGFTTLGGSLKIRNGKLRVERLKVR